MYANGVFGTATLMPSTEIDTSIASAFDGGRDSWTRQLSVTFQTFPRAT